MKRNARLFLIAVLLVIFLGKVGSAYGGGEPFTVDTHTLGLWHFDEGRGKVCKDETGRYDLKIGVGKRKPLWVKGRFGSALEFNGKGYVGFPSLNPYSAEELKQGTMEAWINLSSEGKGKRRVIIDIEGLILFEVGERNNLMLSVYDGKEYERASSTTSLPFGEWHYVAGTWGSHWLKVYLDGKEVGSQNGAEPPLDKFNRWATIGVMQDGPLPFYGIIDEVRISNMQRF